MPPPWAPRRIMNNMPMPNTSQNQFCANHSMISPKWRAHESALGDGRLYDPRLRKSG
jgi:hypothetical protein